MAFERGALIVLEGCDRAGKSTQVKMLVRALNDRLIRAEAMSFPDRTTAIGSTINQYLLNKTELEPGAIHLLFSKNRWERASDMIESLNSGKTLIIDRYAASGAAYAAANTGEDLESCKKPDIGLPRPDLVAFLHIEEEKQNLRGGWGEERFEKQEMQRKVADNFEKLKEDNWEVIDAEQDVEEVHKQLMEAVLKVIERVKHTSIQELYKKD
ncbi:thymidylate kinase [Belonocnema kinseyi]|uniref:thymidylate kinase n=1 Tax=Belonocnema kinseyi TaxID=2817044 RepID=UPI00143CFE78|nr:thymidylate kinase [Belonocnema kinseyi]